MLSLKANNRIVPMKRNLCWLFESLLVTTALISPVSISAAEKPHRQTIDLLGEWRLIGVCLARLRRKARGHVRDWADTMLDLIPSYQQAGLPDATRAAFIIVVESSFVRDALELDVITRLPKFAEAQKAFPARQ